MKAILTKDLSGPEGLILEDHEIGPPGPGRLKIKVKYAGVNFPDILISYGKYQFQPELPFSPGGEVAGIIQEVGEGITDFKPGDRVLSGTTWGGFAEEALGFGFNTYHLPDDILFKDAAAVMVTHGTVIHALKDRARIKEEESLIVLGASGGIGTAAIQVGKILRARVIALTSSKEKMTFCLEAGADEAYSYRLADLKGKIKTLTKGKGADVIIDPIGGDYAEQAFRGIAPMGRYLIVGFAAGSVPKIPLNLPLLKSASLMGVFWGSFFRNFQEENKANIHCILSWMQSGKLAPLVDEVYPLARTREALKRLQDRSVKGKVIVKI